MELDHQLAAAIVARTMHDVGFNVNLMDASGTIIASGDRGRIGMLHRGAVEALRTGRSVETVEDTATEREGINLPFRHDGQAIGVVGITGPLHEVRPLARLVRSSVELLLVQEQAVASRTRAASRAELLAATLLHRTEGVDAELAAEAGELGVDLRATLVALVTDTPTTSLREAATRAGGLWLRDDLVLCGSAQVDAVRRALGGQTVHRSEPSRSPAAAIDGAERTRRVAHALGLTGDQDERRLAALAALASAPADPACAALDAHPELIRTLQAWLRHDLAPAATADDLVLHRNTLGYRLGRIHQLTGRDPRRMPDLVALAAHLLRDES